MAIPKKLNTTTLLSIILVCVLIFGFFSLTSKPHTQQKETPAQTDARIISGSFDKSKMKTDEEWKKILTPEQYHILREAGTETPFTGKLEHETRKGTYYSTGCDKPLFRSEKKYDSGTGWPSFWEPIDAKNVVIRKEVAGDDRIEVLDTCGSHLGHVFADGPMPTGKRFCMNSAALVFVPDKKQ